jgi:glyoxylase-like metal-dependent hydrolase (beta-lactamase superfamily II)
MTSGREQDRQMAAARLIDVMHLGRPQVIGAWLVGDVVIDPGPTSCLDTLLEGLGDHRPRALLLTHIHLDHAGASGSLVERWPDLEVYVHERGAPHLMSPERLIESARMLYGADMDRLWGEMVAVPESNLRVLKGGETLFGGEFEVAYTPGHASHHVSYLHEDVAYVGDTGGVRISGAPLTVPPTPPPDIDVEKWHASIDRIRAWNPRRLVMTHFGWSDQVESQLAEVARRLDERAERVREQDLDAFVEDVRAELAEHVDPDLVEAYIQAAPPDQLYAGLKRYWRKRAEAAPAG